MSERVFGDIPVTQQIRENWKQYQEFMRLAHHARTTTWGLSSSDKRVIGVLVMLEESEALLEHQAVRLAMLESVNDEQAARIRGLELTVAKMKKRADKEAE